jgi:PAS domain S-box-containing protein
MEIENLNREQLIELAQNLKRENDYLKHLNSELDTSGFQINSMLYQVMLNNLPFMAWLKDTTGRFIAVNHFFEQTYKLENEQIISKTEFHILPKDIAQKYVDEDNFVIKNKEPLTIVNMVVENNTEQWYETYKSPVLNSDGNLIALLGISRNITDYYKQEAKIKESEDRLKKITEEIPIGIYRTDKDGNFEHINSTFAKILGFNSVNEVLNKKAIDFYLIPSDRENQLNNWKEGQLNENIYKIIKVDGSEIWIRDFGKVVVDKEQNCTYFDGIIEDITNNYNENINTSNRLKFLENLLNQLPVCISIINKDKKSTYINQEFINYFGFEKSEIINKNIIDSIVQKNKIDECKILFSSAFDSEIFYSDTERIRKTGKLLNVSLTAKKIKGIDSEEYLVVLYNDNEKRKEFENALKTSEERYRLLVENSFDGIYIINESNYEYVNPRFCEITGYTFDELTSPEFRFETLLTDESKIFMKERLNLRLQNKPIGNNYEITIINKKGELVELEVITANIGKNDEIRIQGIMRDVTSRNKSIRNILENSEKFRLLAENMPATVYICQNDEKYSTIYINEHIYDLSGYSKLEFLSGDINFTDIFHPDDYKMIYDNVNKALFEKSNFHLIYRIIDKNKNIRWVEEFGAGVYIKEELQSIEGVMFDISKRLNLEKELRELNSELESRVLARTSELDNTLKKLKYENDERKKISEELNQAKDELTFLLAKEKELSTLKSRFISMVSHEYRTPLTIILTSTYLLDKYFEQNNQQLFKENLKRIQDSVQNIIKLLEEVLSIGKEDALFSDSKKTQVNFISLIGEIINEIRINQPVERQFIFEKDIQNLTLNIDPLNIRHIFTNLFSNAAKYSPNDKPIQIIINNDTENIIVKVIDSGIGIPDDELEFLFTPFHRFANVGTIQGTGLGLTIAKRAADILNAKITVKSKLNEGTEFNVIIPKS